jgi:phosphonate transport system permease protein
MQVTQPNLAVANAAKPDKPTAIDREKLLNPLPRITLRGVLLLALVIGMYAWGIRGTKASPAELIKGVPNMVDFVVRLFPIQFDWTAVAKLPVEIPLPFTVSADKYTDALDGDAQLEQVKEDLAESVPLDQLIESGQPMPDAAPSAQTAEAAPDGVAAEVGPKPWFSWQPSVLNRVWVPGILPSVIETLQMAIIATTLSIFLSLPFALLAARNTSPHPFIYQGVRLFMNSIRAIPELIIALIFVAAVGLGPFTGVLALGIAAVGSISRLYSEAIEQIDPQQVLAVRATGANRLQVFLYAVIPQVLPLIASYSLVYFEYNVRAATIVGIVGAGGVGLALQKYIGLFQFRELMGAVIVLVIAVTIIDRISARLRASLI